MNDHDKAKDQLVAELAAMRRRVAELEASESERRRAEEALREREQWARCIFETVPLGIAECSLDGVRARVNPAFERILGYSSDELEGKAIVDFLEDGPDKAAFPGYLRYLASEQPAPTPHLSREVTKDGRHIDVEVHWNYRRNSQGEVTGFVSVLSDITERKRAETALRESERALREAHAQLEQRVKQRTAELQEANRRLEREIEDRKAARVSLQESEERYRTLVEASPDAIVMTDLEGRITFASDRACEQLGYEHVEDLYGRNPLDFFAPEDHRKFATYLRDTLREGTNRNLEITSLRKDGTRFVSEASAAVIRDDSGNPRALIGLVRDVTEKHRAFEELRQSHDQLEAIYDKMFDGLAIADIETKRLAFTNPALCKMLGYSEEALLSLTVRDLHPPEDWPDLLLKFEAHADGRLIVAEDIPMLRKDGSVFYADVTAAAISYRGRRCNIGVVHDITTRKQAEEALRREYRVLRQMLSAHDRERQLVVYEIHDGLAQYVVGAKMYFEVYWHLQGEDSRGAERAYQQGMELLTRGTAEARRLISGLRPPVLDEKGVVAAIEHLVHDTEMPEGPKLGFVCDVKFGRLDPLLENAIFRIVQESVTNARRHSRSEAVEIRLLEDDGCIQVEIEDSGIGFDPAEIQEASFGIGGIKERARLLGGEATIDSRPGQGTVVRAELPLIEKK